MGRGLRVLHSTGIWLCLAGVLLMISGDGPFLTLGLARWPTPLPFIASPPLYLALLFLGFLCAAAAGLVEPRGIPGLEALIRPLVLLVAAFSGVDCPLR